jgi:DNA-binding response OmpR family regulator
MSILMLSSDPRASDAVLKAGADAFLLKPFQLRQFTQQLYALMSACS